MTMLAQVWNVLLIAIGFGAVIFIHELGHFLAARWAGIRVHAFAVGFGPAVCSWRKGLGFRWGSSERDYKKHLAAADASPTLTEPTTPGMIRGMSHTEYRLNWLPLGGYVKMLGQEDANPSAVSDSPDSFTRKPVWKRMIVISAGVVMNIILAAVLFIVVFNFGIREAAPVIGTVGSGTPAEAAGLRPGDAVLSIDGHPAESFSDLQIAAAMSARGTPIKMQVRNIADDQPRSVSVQAKPGGEMRFMQIGVTPALGSILWEESEKPEIQRETRLALDRAGLAGVDPGMVLVAIDGRELSPIALAGGHTVTSAQELVSALAGSAQRHVTASFSKKDKKTGAPVGDKVNVTFASEREYQLAAVRVPGSTTAVEHLLGLQPVSRIIEVSSESAKKILKPGDLLARVGTTTWPTMSQAITVIREHKGSSLALSVWRDGALVDVTATVDANGLIGFRQEPAWDLPIIAGYTDLHPATLLDDAATAGIIDTPMAHIVGSPPLAGSRVVAVNDVPVASLEQLRDELVANASTISTLKLTLSLPQADGSPSDKTETIEAPLTAADRQALASLGWRAPQSLQIAFQSVDVMLRASNPVEALVMGLRKVQRTMTLTYLTFARLFEGTVRVEHLKGPVGIAHIGSRFAAEGVIYLLYFLALISVNLAVINFLPLPIVDGGLFLMLCYEGITRKPVPERVQAGLTVVGLLLIGVMFVVVTFNDIVGLF